MCICVENERRRAAMQVIMPEDDPKRGARNSSAASGGAATASSGTLNTSALAEKAIAELPPDLATKAIDSKNKARSQDLGWKYGWWPDPTKKDFVQCIFCMKAVSSGIKRFKQHIAGGFGDTMKCLKAPELVRKEMHVYLIKNSRTVLDMSKEGQGHANEEEEEQAAQDEPTRGPIPSSVTKVKQAKKRIAQAAITSFVVSAPPKLQTQKLSKSVSSMLCKSPEEVIAERHKSKTSQSTLEHCTKIRRPNRLLMTMLLISFMKMAYH
ncbi:hypothetical protein GUJ93_ZPchr0008g13406 [Zizania palustris]|uniref:BED-type domain-containing protein n=1 Tax=Zizania palustris TaxID=103762 RepID=A0A8J5REU3_ZIZPA|nr:hypothetical protein GUJ93_ZPchr0008g13406 [Zizania palustris]